MLNKLLPTDLSLDDDYEESLTEPEVIPPTNNIMEFTYRSELLKNRRLEYKYLMAIDAIRRTSELVAAGQVLVAHDAKDLPIVKALYNEIGDLKKLVADFTRREEKKRIGKTNSDSATYADIINSETHRVIKLQDCTVQDRAALKTLRPKQFLFNADKIILRSSNQLADITSGNGIISHPISVIRAKFKVISVKHTTVEGFQIAIVAANPDYHSVLCESLYPVPGPRGVYTNAIITCDLLIASILEEKKVLRIGQDTHRCIEVNQIRQCTSCWSYSHMAEKCTSLAKLCKTCSQDCRRDGACLPRCRVCEIKGLPFNHRNASFQCATRSALITKLKESVFRLAERNLPPDI